MSLRLCYTKTAMLYWVPDLNHPDGGEFYGALWAIAHEYARLIRMVIPNVTVQSDENFASVEYQRKGYLTGCFGRLQQNQSDLIATESLFPTIGQNLTNGPVVHADKMAFLSMYNNTFPLKNADIMQSFSAFSVNVWIMILLSSLFMLLMISASNTLAKSQRTTITTRAKFKRWLEQQYQEKILNGLPATGNLTTEKRIGKHMIDELVLLYNRLIQRSTEGTNHSSLSVATLTLMLLITSFYVTFYFMAIVKTDKVTMTKPSTIESYNDIIKSYPGKWPAFLLNVNSHLPFAQAEVGSKEWRIWQNAKRTGLNKSLISDFYSEDTSLGSTDMIYFAPGEYVKSAACFYCRMRDSGLTAIPMGKSDDSAKENIFVFLLSGHLPSAIAARIMQVVGRLLPSGFLTGQLAMAHREFLITYEDLYVCLSNVVRYPDQNFSGISLDQCNKLIVTVISMYVSSGIMLLIEFLFKRAKNNNK